MPNRIVTVTHPDGSTDQRGSRSRIYTHAVVHKIDRRARVDHAQESLAEVNDRLDEAEAALADGTVTEERRPWSWGDAYVKLYVGGVWADSYVEGGDRGEERPSDESLMDKIREQAAAHRKALKAAQARIERLSTGPEYEYHVVQWSMSEVNAHKGTKKVNPIGRDEVYVVEAVAK